MRRNARQTPWGQHLCGHMFNIVPLRTTLASLWSWPNLSGNVPTGSLRHKAQCTQQKQQTGRNVPGVCATCCRSRQIAQELRTARRFLWRMQFGYLGNLGCLHPCEDAECFGPNLQLDARQTHPDVHRKAPPNPLRAPDGLDMAALSTQWWFEPHADGRWRSPTAGTPSRNCGMRRTGQVAHTGPQR